MCNISLSGVEQFNVMCFPEDVSVGENILCTKTLEITFIF